MKFHLSFFDFCLRNQNHDPLKLATCYINDTSNISQIEIFETKTKTKTYFQSRSSMTGFKKALYNRAKLVRNQLYPSYNRRKYHVCHYNMIKKMCTRLSRTYGYLSQKKIKHFIAFATRDVSPCVKMITFLESQHVMIMYRSLFTKSIIMEKCEKYNKCKKINQKYIFPGQLYNNNMHPRH